jgi:hypothetical protein
MTITITGGVNNVSLQVGDTIYFIPGGSILQTGDVSYSNDISFSSITYRVGILSSFTNTTITVDSVDYPPSVDDFIMFSKDKSVNNTSLIGYYAEVKLKNDSIDAAELFSLSSEITESSK